MSVPAENTVLQCRYCGAMMFFARTPALKNMPLEAKPAKVYRVPDLRPGETAHRCVPVEEEVFIPHWGRCPGADQARKDAQP